MINVILFFEFYRIKNLLLLFFIYLVEQSMSQNGIQHLKVDRSKQPIELELKLFKVL